MAKLQTILIVDDSERCVELLSLAFRTTGAAEVLTESNSTNAVSRILEEPIDLVMLDIKMAGKSGFEVLSDVRKAGRSTPILMCSGSVRQPDVDEAFSIGCNGYFEKPASLDGYREMARTVFEYWRLGDVPQLH